MTAFTAGQCREKRQPRQSSPAAASRQAPGLNPPCNTICHGRNVSQQALPRGKTTAQLRFLWAAAPSFGHAWAMGQYPTACLRPGHLVADHPGPLGRKRLRSARRRHRGAALARAAAAAPRRMAHPPVTAFVTVAGGARRMLRPLVGVERTALLRAHAGQPGSAGEDAGEAALHRGQAAGSLRSARLRRASKPPHVAHW